MKNAIEFRCVRENELGLLKDFLYEAIFIPEGVEPPSRDIVEKPELRVYTDGFGYKKMSQRASGGAYYDSKDNPSEITSKSICLYPNGELTYSWRGVEQKWNKSYRIVGRQAFN